jgi:WD40 repeat protein
MGPSLDSNRPIIELEMKTSLLCFVLCRCLLATHTFASTGSEHRSVASPDGKFTAEISSKEAQFTEDTVTIVSKESGARAEFPMTSKTGANGRNVLKAEWSPDSKFFVFSTFSSGGHSSWDFQTFVYSTDANKFVSVDEKVRPVTDKDFQLLPPHTLQVDTLNPSGIDFPSFERTIDLVSLFH